MYFVPAHQFPFPPTINLNQPKFHVIWFFFSKEMIVYRLLRDGEDVSGGIVQRNPKSKASVVDHIVGGKGNWWAGTKYISFCNSMDAIMLFGYPMSRDQRLTFLIGEI
jgi:hypothetical protein